MMRDCGNCTFYGRCAGRCAAGRPTPWYETPDEVEAGLEWGKRKMQMMRWVRRNMNGTLSRRQRECVELFLFKGMTYQQIAKLTGTDKSAVCRAVRRSVVRLQHVWKQQKAKP